MINNNWDDIIQVIFHNLQKKKKKLGGFQKIDENRVLLTLMSDDNEISEKIEIHKNMKILDLHSLLNQ
ncbi:MAG: hypothetical protein OEY49_17720 [Candidatus Heimdallarchaeota archaeon]|nr:hypothetical protein [Candidatus Heimdallarchaeota archaeon]